MKNEPCVRFGIFMSPKISENPADRRNRRPPSVMLLTASTTHKLMSFRFERRLCRRNLVLGEVWRGPSRRKARLYVAPSRLEGRIVARVDWLRQEPLLVVGPELADLGIGLDRRVDELVALPLASPDVEAPHHVAEAVERKRPAGRVGERHGAQGSVQRVLVVGLSAGLLQRGLGDH